MAKRKHPLPGEVRQGDAGGPEISHDRIRQEEPDAPAKLKHVEREQVFASGRHVVGEPGMANTVLLHDLGDHGEGFTATVGQQTRVGTSLEIWLRLYSHDRSGSGVFTGSTAPS